MAVRRSRNAVRISKQHRAQAVYPAQTIIGEVTMDVYTIEWVYLGTVKSTCCGSCLYDGLRDIQNKWGKDINIVW